MNTYVILRRNGSQTAADLERAAERSTSVIEATPDPDQGDGCEPMSSGRACLKGAPTR